MDYPFGLSLAASVRVELPLDGLRPCVFVQVKPEHGADVSRVGRQTTSCCERSVTIESFGTIEGSTVWSPRHLRSRCIAGSLDVLP